MNCVLNTLFFPQNHNLIGYDELDKHDCGTFSKNKNWYKRNNEMETIAKHV